MCGIVASLNFDRDRPVDAAELARMTATLTHRGPDDDGVWTDGPVGLGHRRLSIIDLSRAGRGPMANADGSLVVSFNGEIYNHRELRPLLESRGHEFRTRTDTEVILHAYREWGLDCLERLNGMFAFALWDAARRRLFVARDRFGVKPLVYYSDDRRFLCGSEIKALLATGLSPRVNPVALHHYLSLTNIPAPFTIYDGIHKLRPGHYLLVEDGRVVKRRWWLLEPPEETRESEAEIVERLDELVADSVRLRLISDAPLGAFLSGGVDSSVLSAVAARQRGGEPLRTFSIAFSGQYGYDESRYSQSVARHIGSEHTEIDLQKDLLDTLPEAVRMFDEPFAVPSALAVYAMARETSRHVKVVLTGDGGDEIFGGYFRHTVPDARFDRLARLPLSGLRRLNRTVPRPSIGWRIPPRMRRLQQLAIALTTPDETLRTWRFLQFLQVLNEREKFALYTPAWAERVRRHPDYSSTDDYLMQFLPQGGSNRLVRWLCLDVQTSLADEMLSKVDRTTMAWGLEARTPFLDYRLVQYAMTIPATLMSRAGQSKRLLKRLGERYVPQDVLYRKKQGLTVPLRNWFRGDPPDLLRQSLTIERTRSDGVFRASAVAQLLSSFRSDEGSSLANAIYGLSCFGLWSAMRSASSGSALTGQERAMRCAGSVVVIARNEEPFIGRALQSVTDALAGRDFELLVVDSASTDRTAEIAGSFPGARLVRIPDHPHLGPALARYVGLRHARGEWVLFLDGDMTLAPGWIDGAVDALSADPELAGVSGGIEHVFPASEGGGSMQQRFPETDYVEALTLGGAALYRGAAIRNAGGFNPLMRSCEEEELAARLRQDGYRLVRLRAPMVRHHARHRGETPRETLRRLRRGFYFGMGQLARQALSHDLPIRRPLRPISRHLAFVGLMVLGLACLAVGLGSGWWLPGLSWSLIMAALLGLFVLRAGSLQRPFYYFLEWGLTGPSVVRGMIQRPAGVEEFCPTSVHETVEPAADA